MSNPIDWHLLANDLGLIEPNEGGRSESSGTRFAQEALERLLSPDAMAASVDYYVSGAPGSDLARSVLWLLHPWSAMDRCHRIFLEAGDVEDRRAAVELLRVVADERVLEWVPQYLADPDEQIQMWGIGVVDQLVFSRLADADDCAPILSVAVSHPSERVREKAEEIRRILLPK